MRKIVSFIFCVIFALLSSCMYVGNENKKDYHIERTKRISKLISVEGFPIEKIQNNYHIESCGKQSAVLIGYVIHSKTVVGLYITDNSQVKHEQIFPVDDKMEIELLRHVMDVIKNRNEHYTVKSVQISMKTCGVANLNIARKYWQTRLLDKNIFQQSLFNQIRNTLNEYGYDVYDISKNDFYPLTARDIRSYHTIPDSCSLNSIAINGIIDLRCKNVNIEEQRSKR